jgi:uncharacterized protein HemY
MIKIFNFEVPDQITYSLLIVAISILVYYLLKKIIDRLFNLNSKKS